MNIYAQYGDKVIFTGRGGYPVTNAHARNVLRVGNVYTVERTVVHSTSTEVYLIGKPRESFNSVMFEDYAEILESVPVDNVLSAQAYSVPSREWSVDSVQAYSEPEVVRETFTSGGGGDFGGGGATSSWEPSSSDTSSSDSYSSND